MKKNNSNKNSPLISVIVPTYNRAHTILRCIHSVQQQTYEHWELIVIDNFSNDDTEGIIQKLCDKRIRFYKVHNEGCVALSRNLGIKKSTGSYIAFLDSDDWWTPKKLEHATETLKSGAQITYHDFFLFSENAPLQLFRRKVKTRELREPVFDDLFLKGNALINSGVVVDKKVFDDIGYLSTDFSLIAAEDYDFWLRAALANVTFIRIPIPLGFYSLGENNLSSLELSNRSALFLLRKYKSSLKKIGGRIPAWMAMVFLQKSLHGSLYKRSITLIFLIIFYHREWRFIWRSAYLVLNVVKTKIFWTPSHVK